MLTPQAESSENYSLLNRIAAVIPANRAVRIPELSALLMRDHLPTSDAVLRQALVAMVKGGHIQRIRHGMYARPGYVETPVELDAWTVDHIAKLPEHGFTARALAAAFKREQGYSLPLELFDIALKHGEQCGQLRELRTGTFQHKSVMFS